MVVGANVYDHRVGNPWRIRFVSHQNIKVSNSQSHVWPAVRLGLAAEISALVVELDRTQWLSREQIESRQMGQLVKLLRFVVAHSPYYAKRFASSGADMDDLRSIEALRTLPLLSRHDIQSAGADFFCTRVPADQGKVSETQTSGSTGEPVRVRRSGIAQLFWHAFTLRNHFWYDLPFAARYTMIRANIREYQEHPDWGAPFVFLYETGPAQLIPINTPLDRQIELLQEFQPETLLIYPNNLGGLLDRWREEGFGLSKLRRIKTMGETLTEELRRRVAELAGEIALFDCYSSEECGAIALQCPLGEGYHVMSEALILEVLDDDDNPCAPGQIGRIVITDLHNLASPIIRYDIRDYAQLGEPCACGRGLLKLDRILGRQRNLVVKPNGDRHWPLVGFHDFGAIAPIRQYQVIQETVERLTVRFVTNEPLAHDQKTAFIRLMQGALGYEFEMEILDQRDDLPRLANGKFEEFISKVS